jgi:flavin-binding protein dodecin
MSRHALLALLILAVTGTHARSADDAKDEAVQRFKEALQGLERQRARLSPFPLTR